MNSHVHSDGHVGGHYYLTTNNVTTMSNGANLMLLAIIKHVVSSASEAELGALLYHCKNALPICTSGGAVLKYKNITVERGQNE